jgi:AraC family transcriptional activator of pobA
MNIKKKKNIASYEMIETDLRVLEIIRNQYSRFSTTKYLEPHRRNYFSFFLMKSGALDLHIDFKNYRCRAQDIFFVKPQQVLMVGDGRGVSGITVSFKAEILTAEELSLPIVVNKRDSNKLTCSGPEFQYLYRLLKNMVAEQHDKGFLWKRLLRNLLGDYLLYASRIYTRQSAPGDRAGSDNPIALKFQSLIEKNWQELQVTDYAKILCISPGHLNFLSKQFFDKKASYLIQEKKLLEAKRLLFHSAHSIKEIAYRSGFSDPAYFNRFFLKRTGLTPALFRKKIHEKYNQSV